MGIGMTLVQAAERAWSDPRQREQIVQMHAEGVPLEEMVDRLGLGREMDADGLREIVRELPGDAVDAIRKVFVAEAGVASGSGAFFPVDCRVEAARGPVRVQPQDGTGGGGDYVRVDPA